MYSPQNTYLNKLSKCLQNLFTILFDAHQQKFQVKRPELLQTCWNKKLLTATTLGCLVQVLCGQSFEP